MPTMPKKAAVERSGSDLRAEQPEHGIMLAANTLIHVGGVPAFLDSDTVVRSAKTNLGLLQPFAICKK